MIKPVNAVIIEDMPIAEEHLKKMLKDNCPDVKIIAAYSSAKEAVKHLDGLNYDLLFLDIEYNDGYNAFQMLKDVEPKEAQIIFTTAFEQYRKEASDVDSVKYLLKPIKKEELVKAVERSNFIRIGKEMLTLIEKKHYAIKQEKFIINTGGVSYFINPSEVVYMEASGPYTNIYYYSDNELKKILSTQNIGKYESILPKQNFIRIHRKYLVNISFVKTCHHNRLKLAAGDSDIEVLISKDRRKKIIESIALCKI